MKHALTTLALLAPLAAATAQTADKPFAGLFENAEYNVYLRLNLYDNDVEVPGHELYGPLPGYLGKRNNSFCWLITDAEAKKGKATATLVNDFGSEDLTATLTLRGDSTLVLKQGGGSPIKVPNKGKWQKLPSTLEFTRK